MNIGGEELKQAKAKLEACGTFRYRDFRIRFLDFAYGFKAPCLENLYLGLRLGYMRFRV